MRRFFFITTIWICAFSAFAQEEEIVEKAGNSPVLPPKLALKWSVFHQLYFYPSWQFSLEHRLLKYLNIQYEGGWVVNSNPNFSGYEDKRGYRIAAELRYYFPSSPRMIPFYVAGEVYYHNIRFDRRETFGFNCDSGMCDYFQSVTYPVRTEEIGPALKFGMLMFPGWRHNRLFFFDLNAGFAYRKINYSYTSRPSGEGLQSTGDVSGITFFAPNEEVTEKLRFVIGARFCFRIL